MMAQKKKVSVSARELLDLYNSGNTTIKLAKRYEVSRARICQILATMPEYKRSIKPNMRGGNSQKSRQEKSIEFFWSRVDKSGGPDACWPWIAAKYPRGYGRSVTNSIPGTGKYAHRTAYILTYGSPDPSLDICHRCNNPSCCNPSHLYAGTAKQNIKDREDRYARGELIRKYNRSKKSQKDGAQ